MYYNIWFVILARPSDDQWNTLIDLIAMDKEILHGQFLAPGGVQRTHQKWEDIAAIVNSVPGATVTKDGEQWRLAWVGLRSRARTSLRNMSAYRNGTGGGPDVDVAGLAISKLYKRVLGLTGITAAVGSRCP
ncbi:uncharacterized protein LOC127751412 [Frankliniella occidentalis]|uniref:Regulatory protein zeste n=1 Tax=Frankliniella occidentalis TaxID=133901 RepID=A0A9C6XTX2_FRAOC|nr:uncharacterized protein LOC127751412 [Frankliniella occidentalis]